MLILCDLGFLGYLTAMRPRSISNLPHFLSLKLLAQPNGLPAALPYELIIG